MQSDAPIADTTELSLDSAQKEFSLLVNTHRHTALWFMKPDVSIDVSSPTADLVLDQIAQKASRSNWLVVRKLKRWRSQNFK